MLLNVIALIVENRNIVLAHVVKCFVCNAHEKPLGEYIDIPVEQTNTVVADFFLSSFVCLFIYLQA